MEPKTINGVEIRKVEDLAEALEYMREDYNDDSLNVYEHDDSGRAIHIGVKARARTLPFHVTDAVQRAAGCYFSTISVREECAYVEVKDPKHYESGPDPLTR